VGTLILDYLVLPRTGFPGD